MSKGMTNLASALQQRMHQVNEKPSMFGYGTIKADGSVLPDDFPIPIPKDEYQICRSLVQDDPLVITSSSNGHTHTVPRPEGMAPLKAGDRVLLLWVGSDVCIIDVVYQGNI